MTQTPAAKEVTEFSLDASADAVVDLAMHNVDPRMTREQRDALRTQLQDAVDALIDQCRAFYRNN